jgi:hypothetical protein
MLGGYRFLVSCDPKPKKLGRAWNSHDILGAGYVRHGWCRWTESAPEGQPRYGRALALRRCHARLCSWQQPVTKVETRAVRHVRPLKPQGASTAEEDDDCQRVWGHEAGVWRLAAGGLQLVGRPEMLQPAKPSSGLRFVMETPTCIAVHCKDVMGV